MCERDKIHAFNSLDPSTSSRTVPSVSPLLFPLLYLSFSASSPLLLPFLPPLSFPSAYVLLSLILFLPLCLFPSVFCLCLPPFDLILFVSFCLFLLLCIRLCLSPTAFLPLPFPLFLFCLLPSAPL
jgi:hypothetical protein